MPQRLDRRGFLRRMAGRPSPQRPPGALPEHLFAETCDGCGACVRRCPQAIILAGAAGLPQIDFARGGCSFCGACGEACPTGALAQALPVPPWTLRAAVAEDCLEQAGIACRVCESACDEAALRFRPMPGGRAAVLVSADRCTGCGACVSACPAGAITVGEPQSQPQTQESAA